MSAAAPHHRLAVNLHLGALDLLVDLPLHSHWTLLFGPSGSGKSTLLRAACGLLSHKGVRFSRREPPGYDVPLLTRAHATAPHQLGLGYAPQQGALFPHMTVEANIAFPHTARSERMPPGELSNLLALFEIEHLRARTPQLLSGGERQRVNLARAFAVPDARLLLLDEPFTGLGRDLRDRLLERVRASTQQRKLPVLSVSHDVEEALLLDADVAVLEAGKVVRRGPAAQALAAERETLLRSLTQDRLPDV